MPRPKSIQVDFGDEKKGGPHGSMTAIEKTFSTGSQGYFVSGKLIDPDAGESYQVTCSIVRVGSKPDGKKK